MPTERKPFPLLRFIGTLIACMGAGTYGAQFNHNDLNSGCVLGIVIVILGCGLGAINDAD